MSEQKSTGKAPEQPKAGIPQDVADAVAVLAGEVKAFERSRSRAWKTALVIWVILLAVIASYLNFLVYRPLTRLLDAETLVAMGIGKANDVLAGYGAPRLDSGQLPTWAADKLKAQAPLVMESQLKPFLLGLQDQLPDYRKQAEKQITEQAPRWVDAGIDRLETDVLPQLNEQLLSLASKHIDSLMAQVEADINRVMGDVIKDVGTSAVDLQDQAKMRAAFEEAFEREMGPVLDELFVGLDEKVAAVGEQIGTLVTKYKSGSLSHQEQLEVRLIQLVRALFEKARAEEPGKSGLQLQGINLEGILKPGGAAE